MSLNVSGIPTTQTRSAKPLSFPLIRLRWSPRPLSQVLFVAVALFCCLTPAWAQRVVATVAAGTNPVPAAVNPVTNRIYVASYQDATVKVIDGSSNAVVATVSVASPGAIAVNPVTNMVYVADTGANTVTVINGATNVAGTPIAVGTAPIALAVNPVTNMIYVGNQSSNNVSIIDGSSNTVIATLAAGTSPQVIGVNPVTNKIYVVNNLSNNVTVINGAASPQSVVATVNVGANALAIGVNPVTNLIYVANSGSSSVTVINGALNTTGSNLSITVGSQPRVLTVNPVSNKIYVANHSSGTVTVIDGTMNTTGSNLTVTVGSAPVSVAVNPTTNQIYVANHTSGSGGGTVSVINGSVNTTGSTATVPLAVGAFPVALVVNPVTNQVYTANQSSNNVTVIDGATDAIATVAVGTIGVSYRTSVAVNPATNNIYVAGSFANDVTVIDGATNVPTNVSVGLTPTAVAVNPVTNKIYAVNAQDSTVAVIDGATSIVTATVPVGTIGVSYGTAVAVNPVTNQIYVSGSFANNLTVIDGVTNATTTVAVGLTPTALAVNPVTNKIYVVNTQDNTVSVIDGATSTVSATVTVGTSSVSYRTDIAVNPVTNKIYVADSFANNVTVIDGATNTTSTVVVGLTPIALAVNQVTNRIYVVNAQDSTVSVINGANGTVTATVPVGTIGVSYGTGVTVNLATDKIYVTGSFANNITEIDGATNTTATLAVGLTPTAIATNLATGSIYPVNAQDSTVSAIAEEQVQSIPLTTTITPLAGNVSTTSTPTFTFTPSSAFAPVAPAVQNVYFQLDTWEGPWIAATPGAGTFTATSAALQQGTHVVYAYATDGEDADFTANSQHLIGRIAAEVFTVILPGSNTTLAAAPNPAGVGQSVTFTADVSSGGAGTLTGTVTFFNGATSLGSDAVASGTATLATSALTLGSHSITAVYSGDGNFSSSTSAIVTEVIAVSNPVPVASSLAPNSTTAGGAGFTLTVNGSNFVAGSVVQWNGAALATTFVNAGQLTATVPGGDIAASGTASVTVFNSTPGGGTSNALTFTINNPLPAQTSLSPTSATLGGAGFTLTVNGSNFVAGSVVKWNGVALTTTFLSGTQLTATVPAGDLAASGTASVTVFNATPAGGTSNALTFTINNPVATLTSLSPNSVSVGGVGFTLTVNGANFLAGSVVRWNGVALSTTFVSSTQLTAAVPAGDLATVTTASITVFNSAPGGGTSNALIETVAALTATTTTLTASPNPVVVGQPVTFTGTVSPAPTGSTLGTVSFFSGATLLGTGTVNSSGVATFATSGLTVGAGSITAVYSGNALFATSTSVVLTETVAPKTPTSTTLAASSNPVVVGQPVTFTVTVSPAPTGSTLGTVSFFSGSTLLGMGTVDSSGAATFATSGLPVGAGSITAVYSGNALFATSTSVVLTETVAPKTATSTTLVASPNPVVVGQPVSFTVTVSPAPTGSTLGTVSFFSGSTLLGMGTVDSSGVATFATSGLPVGAGSITAVYSGNALFATSTSVVLTETVAAKTATSTTLVASPNPVVVGQPVSFTVTVSPAPTGSTLGTVSFFSGSTLLGMGTVNSSGVATFATSGLSVGAGSITAVYSGNALFATSTSVVLTETVAPLTVTSTTLVVSPNPVVAGQPATFAATIAPAPTGSTTGTVSFFSGATLLGTATVNSAGVATLVSGSLPAGADVVTAVYSGNPGFAGSTSAAASIAVAKVTTSAALTASSASIVLGQSITLTVTVSPLPTGSPLGAVSFYSGTTLLGTATVNSSGIATLASSALAAGTDAVTGVYSGNLNFAASTSAAANITVTVSAPAVVTVAFNPASPVYGQVTTVTVLETAGGVAAAGATATVAIGSQTYTCTTNASGRCVVTLPAGVLSGGSNTVTVTTSATASAAAGVFTFAVAVGPAVSTLTLGSSSTQIVAGTPVTLTATVASAAPGAPTGTVTFYANGTSIGSGTVAGGVASLTLSSLATGANSISATYGGDANFLGSTASGFTQTVLVNFTITAGSGGTPPTQTTPPGGTAVFPLSLGIINGFVGPVTMSATGLPPGASASFNPAILNLDGVHPGTTVMSVETAAGNAQAVPVQTPRPGSRSPIRYGLVLLPLLAVGGIRKRLRALPPLLAALGVLSLGAATAGLSGCGNGGYFGAAPASYVITVTATSGALHHSTTVTLTIQ